MRRFWLFSEAIRAGAAIRPQAGQLFERLPSGEIGSCAIGAGYEAITDEVDLRRSVSIYSTVARLYPYIETPEWFHCHVRDCRERPLWGRDEIILHFNDDHQWTREQIADWLEGEEEKLGLFTTVIFETEQEQSSSQGYYVKY